MSGRLRLDDPAARRLLVLFLAGAVIRLAVMPFTLHFDAYQIYSRAAEAAYHNQWFGFTSQFLIQELHNVWLLLVRPLLPDSAGIWSPTASTLGVGATRADYERFLAYDHLFRLIFLMKLPYVVADLASAWVLTRLVAPARRVATAAFWLLNPLVIFSSAVYGRHDSIAILLVLLSLLVVRGGSDARRLAGLGLLGAATLMRFFPIVVVPFFLLAFRRSRRQLALFLGLLVGMAALVEIAGLVTSGKSTFLTVINSYEHLQYWFDAGFYLRFDDWIFLFPVAYVILLFWLVERGIAPDEYPRLSAVAFLLVFALTFFHPPYAIWLAPFLALTIAWQPRMVVYHAIQVACVLVYSAQWGAWTTWNLLEPLLGDRVASLPDPVESISAQIEPRIFFGLFRSLLTAISLWMAWRLLRDLGRLPLEPRGPKIAEERQPKTASKAAVTAALLPVLLLTTGCTARVSGYSSPIAHDYAGLLWEPLKATMIQPFLAGTGIAAAIADDPKTTPAELQQRQAALPADARSGGLDELRVALRLDAEPGRAWQTGARLQLRYDPDRDPRFPERDFHVWDPVDAWLPGGGLTTTQTFVSPYDRLDGVTLRIATFGGDLSPGPATVGDRPVDVRAMPVDGTLVETLPASTVVEALGTAEGWAQVRLSDDDEGFVPLGALAEVTPPATRPAGSLRVALLDAAGAVLRETAVSATDLHDNSHLTVRFDPVEDAAGRSFAFRFDVPTGVTLRVAAGDAYADGARDGGADDLLFRPSWAEQPLLADAAVDALPRSGDWVELRDAPDIRPGTAVAIEVAPGGGPDAKDLLIGTTPGRVPYGAWPADGLDETGSLGIQTRYQRDVDLGGIARAGGAALRAGARADLGFAALLVVGVAGLTASAAGGEARSARG
ncbi:MAG TPA: hypothetical protein PKA95_08150, partial [Thermomicrobiales bacterium]|nr:hypothetical protein [Thermomicrobiales bacterium]